MRSLLALTIIAIALTGCVTETSYKGTDKPVTENKLNNETAARTRISLALQYLSARNNSQAKYNLERAMELAPNSPETHYSFAYYYQQVGEDALADKAYQKALSIKPDDPNTLNNYGVFLCGIDEYDRATDQFLKAIEIPSYIRVAESYENLALCAIEFDDFDAAENYFKQAMNHSSQRDSTLISLAALYYAKSDLHKSGELLELYEDKGRVSARALLLSYLVKQRIGHIEAAEKIALTIKQTYPSSNEADLLRENAMRKSEFEILRNKYRKASLKELNGNADREAYANSAPRIKIKRKKRSSTDNSTSLVTKAASPVVATTAAIITPIIETDVQRVEVGDEQPTPVTTTPTETHTLTKQLTAATNKDVPDQHIENNEPGVTTQKQRTPAVVNHNNVSEIASILQLDQTATTVETSDDKDTESNAPEVKTDTSAVLTALTTEHKVEKDPVTPVPLPPVIAVVKTAPDTLQNTPVAPSAVTVNTPKDGVKIISFGAPKTTNVNVNTPAPNVDFTQPDPQPTDTVVFYEAKKNDAVFANNNNQTEPRIELNSYQADNPIELPMLNPKITPINVPFHIIQFGENLFSISVRYNVKLQKLLQWNGLKESDRVMNGSKIYLNDPHVYYEIKAGDTLYSIATQQQVLIDELMRWNKLSPDIALKAGHRLLLVNPDSYTL
jgi:type IV pilus biogenesis/stability protein PilW